MINKQKTSVTAPRRLELGLLVFSLVISGVLMALCLDAAQYRYLLCIVLVPIFVAVRTCAPIQGAFCGAAWGLALFISCRAGVGPSLPLTPATFLPIIALPAAFVGLGSLLTRRIGFSPYVLSVGWMALELSLSPIITLSPREFVDQSLTQWLGSLAAPVLMGFCVALVNAALLELTACTCAIRLRMNRSSHPSLETVFPGADFRILSLLSLLGYRHPRDPP